MKTRQTIDASHRLLTPVVALLIAMVLAAGCSSSDGSAVSSELDSTATPSAVGSAQSGTDPSEAPVSTTTVETAGSSGDAVAVAAEVLGGGVVLEAHDMRVEASGVQMRVERVVQRFDATFVRLAIVNGSEKDREVPHHQVANLTTPDGMVHEPTAAFPSRGIRLETGESTVVVLVFPPTTGPFDLEVGIDGLLTDPFSRLVGFVFDDLDADTVVGGLQPDAALRAVGTHDNGTQIELDGIRFTSDRIGVGVEIRNGSPFELWMFGADETFLEDDLGNRYRALVKPNGPTFFELGAESSLTGVLVFAGRLDPRARRFTIFVNDGGLLTNPSASSPAFVLGPFDVGAAQAVAVPLDAAVGVTIDQVNGSTATLSAFTFDERTIRANVTVVNESDERVDFNRGLTYVVDSEGITYRSQIAELPELVLGPGEGFEGEIVFSGRLQPTATSVRLTINHGGLMRHSFFFDPVEVNRSSRAAVLADFDVDETSRFVIGSLDTTSVAAIAVAIAEFDGIEVEGGVLLTLPEAILFDFAESTLRPDAADSIELVADILAYYEGDEVFIVGHTDAVGDEASNLSLSEARAAAVYEALASDGVSRSLMSTEGRGESEPVAANENPDGSDNAAGRQLNRRVEILIETTKGIPNG